MRRVATAVAAVALLAGAVQVQAQGNGKGNDKGGGKPAPTAQQGGGQGGGQGRGNADKADRGRGNDGPSMAQAERGPDQRGNAERASGRGNDDRGNGNDRAVVVDRGRGNDRAVAVDRGRGNDDRIVAADRRDDRAIIRIGDLDQEMPRTFVTGCPPGLAKKNPPCVPPGQVRNDGWSGLFGRPDFWGFGSLGDGRYFYDDGYLVRLGSDGRIGGYIPLLGGALAIGNPWPSFYEPVRLPGYYENYYGLGPYGGYRYANDVIYQVDPDTAAITSIAALLTGDDFAIGQPMPLGYDVYNVPYGYRDQYFDRPDALYRYSDGYIYEVDPETRLIAAAIELLVS